MAKICSMMQARSWLDQDFPTSHTHTFHSYSPSLFLPLFHLPPCILNFLTSWLSVPQAAARNLNKRRKYSSLCHNCVIEPPPPSAGPWVPEKPPLPGCRVKRVGGCWLRILSPDHGYIDLKCCIIRQFTSCLLSFSLIPISELWG